MPRSSLERGNRQAWILGALAAGLIFALAAVTLVFVRESTDSRTAANQRAAITQAQQDRLECIATWANTLTRRIQQHADADRGRIAALDQLARTLAHADPAQWRAAVARYHAASSQYAARIKAHPLPPAPKFLCDRLPSSTLPGPAVVTVTPAPATVTRTVHATVTAPAAPRATVTRTAARPTPTDTPRPPAPTHTRTRPRPPAAAPPSPRCLLGILC